MRKANFKILEYYFGKMEIIPELSEEYICKYSAEMDEKRMEIERIVNMDKHKTLFLVRGLPNTGKTTVAKKMVEEGLADAHLEADQYFETRGGWRFDASQLGKAHKQCQFRAKSAMKAGLNVVVSNTFSMQWELEPYRELAKQFGYIVVETTEYGVKGDNGHNVPQKIIDNMIERWEIADAELERYGSGL